MCESEQDTTSDVSEINVAQDDPPGDDACVTLTERELRDGAITGHDRSNGGKLGALCLVNMKKTSICYSGVNPHGLENVMALFRQGAGMAAGNDEGVPPCTPAMIRHEMTMFDFLMNRDPDGATFTGADAVRIATINGARSPRLDHDTAAVAAGSGRPHDGKCT